MRFAGLPPVYVQIYVQIYVAGPVAGPRSSCEDNNVLCGAGRGAGAGVWAWSLMLPWDHTREIGRN